MDRASARKLLSAYFEGPATDVLSTLGISPNALTLLTLPAAGVSAYLVSVGSLAAGGVALLIGGLLDMLDGALARATGRETAFGALLDSTVDRVSESLVLLGVLLFYLDRPGEGERLAGALLVFTALVGSSLVSYVRARAEGLDLDCKVGVMTRPERIAVLAAGLVIGQSWTPAVIVALGVVSVLTAVTTVQRVFHVRNLLAARQDASGAGRDSV